MEYSKKIPVTFEGKVVGYTYDEKGPLAITDEEFKKKFLEMSNKQIGISSRATGKINENGTIERDYPNEFSIIENDDI